MILIDLDPLERIKIDENDLFTEEVEFQISEFSRDEGQARLLGSGRRRID